MTIKPVYEERPIKKVNSKFSKDKLVIKNHQKPITIIVK
jgi:hypothetical protein